MAAANINKFDVLSEATSVLRDAYRITFDIGESFSISDVYRLLNSVPGVVDTTNVTITTRIGGNYSDYSFNVRQNMSADGRMLHIPKDHILEIKLPSKDIIGTVT